VPAHHLDAAALGPALDRGPLRVRAEILAIGRDAQVGDGLRRVGRGVAGLMAAPLAPDSVPDTVGSSALRSVLDGIVVTLNRFLVLPEYAAEAVCLWIAHSYVLEAAFFTPRLVLTSAVMRCGKSTALTLISNLVHRPVMVASATSSSIFRVMHAETCTLLLDEADGWIHGDLAIRTVVNGGYSRATSIVMRTDTDTFQAAKFDAFGPMALAGIGQPDPTILDRAIVIWLRRKTSRDRVERFRGATIADELQPLREQLAAWGADAAHRLHGVEPAVPDRLDDRACDLWDPLLAIADEAGGTWPGRARAAALHLSAQRLQGETDDRLRLLEDLRQVIGQLDGDRFPTSLLLRKLVAIEGSPWSDFARGKPITSRKLADLLRPFLLQPVTVRLQDGSTPKGYKREDLDSLFEQYLDPEDADPGDDDQAALAPGG
jgi:putative DNA primase/helicase